MNYIGRQVNVDESFDPQTNETLPQTTGIIVDYNDDWGLFAVLRDDNQQTQWHDSRTIKLIDVRKTDR